MQFGLRDPCLAEPLKQREDDSAPVTAAPNAWIGAHTSDIPTLTVGERRSWKTFVDPADGGCKQWCAGSVSNDKSSKAITTSTQAMREPCTSPELPLVIVIPRVKVKGCKHHAAQASEFAGVTGIGPTHRGQNLGSHRGPGAGIHGPTF